MIVYTVHVAGTELVTLLPLIHTSITALGAGASNREQTDADVSERDGEGAERGQDSGGTADGGVGGGHQFCEGAQSGVPDQTEAAAE